KSGSAGAPKYARYFNFDKAKPTVAITTPSVSSLNIVGGTYVLQIVSGTSADNNANEAGVQRVEFALQLNQAEPTQHLEHYETSAAWKTVASEIWNEAYPQGPPSDRWSVWTSSNIPWFESDVYVLKVRSIDQAGNVSNEQSRSFTYDRALPTSRVVTPAHNSRYTTQLLSIAGTAVDDTSTSTGTSSGISGLGVAITRASDGYHWNGSTWAAGAISSMTVSIGQGLGVKNWSLSLSSTFYDLLPVVVDTFTVYSFATDLVDNPSPLNANREPSNVWKSTFVFESGLPLVSVVWPPAASAQNAVSTMTLSVDAVGSGISQIWTVAVSSDGAYYWTGSSWGATGVIDPNISPDAYGLWLTTDTAGSCGAGQCTPDLVFTPPISATGIQVVFSSTHSIQAPAWENGRKYRIYVKARNAAGQTGTSYGGTYAFIYDVEKPTVTLSSGLAALSADPAARTWVQSLGKIDGIMNDNTPDGLNIYSVFVRLYSPGEIKFLDPSLAPPTFTLADGNLAWKEVPITGAALQRAWEWDLSGVTYLGGFSYDLEVYARDRAKNSTGTAVAPVYQRYFKFDSDKPLLVVSTPVAGGAYGLNTIDRLRGESSDPTAISPQAVEFKLTYPPFNKWEVLSSSSGWWNPDSGISEIWNVAATTTTAPFQVWQSSNIAWVSGEEYTFIARARDQAGNVSANSTTTFKYDSHAPATSVTKPVDGKTYSAQVSVISGNTIDQPETNRQAGLELLRVGVRRLSDGKWWTGPADGWQTVRNDYSMPPPGGTAWSHIGLGGFWTGVPTAETFEVYGWARDLVDDPFPSFRNVEASTTLKATFKYEVQAPSSTIVTPENNRWYSEKAGFDLTLLRGWAVDLPTGGPGAGGSVTLMQVQVRRGNNDTACWGGTDFNTDCTTEPSWISMTLDQLGPPTTYQFDVTGSGGVWEKSLQGESYRVRFRGKDSARDGTESLTPNVESAFESGRNERTYKVDRQGPVSKVTSPCPATGDCDLGDLFAVTGTAQDSDSGLHTTYLAACEDDGAGGVNANACLTSLGGGGTFTTTLRYFESHQVSSPTAQIGWSFDTTSVAWVNGTRYHILARSSDTVRNGETTNGGYAGATNHTRFRKIAAAATGKVTDPSANDPSYPFYKPASLVTLRGTAADTTHVQIRIKEKNNSLYWDGSGWVPGSDTWVPAAPTPIAVAAGNWSYPLPGGAGSWRVNQDYEIDLRECNALATVCGAGPTYLHNQHPFVIDSSGPVVGMSVPDGVKIAQRGADLRTLKATVSDPTSPIQDGASLDIGQIYFEIVREHDGKEWSVPESTFVTSGSNLYATLNGGLWEYTTDYLTTDRLWDDGYRYKVRILASDKAGNASSLLSAIYRYDVSFGTATVTLPVTDWVLNSVPELRGAMSDPNPKPADPNSAASGVDGVEVRIQSLVNGNYFNGTNFGTSDPNTWLAAGYNVSAGTWSYADPDLDGQLASGRFVAVSRVKDKAGNVQSLFAGNGSSITFTVDKDRPTLAITLPPAGTISDYTPAAAAANGVQGSASDPLVNGTSSGLLTDGVDVVLWCLSDGTSYYWDSTNWSTSVSTVATGQGWSLALKPNEAKWQEQTDRECRVQARVHDKTRHYDGSISVSSGNASFWTAVSTFIVDGTPPVSSMTWPRNGLYLSAVSSITGTAQSALSGLDIVELKITSNDATGPWWDGSGWSFVSGDQWRETDLSGVAWQYPGATGESFPAPILDHVKYFVYSRAKDKATNVQSPVTAFEFRSDKSTPTVAFSMPVSPPTNPAYSNNGESVRPVAVTSGTISDPGPLQSGPVQVWLAISSGASENVWWHDGDRDFTVSQSTIHWSTQVYMSGTGPGCSGSACWSYGPSELAGKFSNGVGYKAYVKALDIAGNWSPNVTQSFKYDVQRPSATVTGPANGSARNSLASLAGNAVDAGTGISGVKSVYAAIEHITGPSGQIGWWDWTAQQFDNALPLANAWTEVATTTAQGVDSVSWSTPVPAGMLSSSNTYRVVARAFDWATNEQQNPGAAGTGSTFQYDVQTPTVTATLPAVAAYLNAGNLGALQGTAADAQSGNSGMQTVAILLKQEVDDRYWKGTNINGGAIDDNWDTTPDDNWVSILGPLTSWTTGFPTMSPMDSRRFRLWVRGADAAGNATEVPDAGELAADLEADGVTSARSFVYDESAPVSKSTGPLAYLRLLPTGLAGTAADTRPLLEPSGLNEVKVRLRRSDSKFWNFVDQWDAPQVWSNVTSSLSSWSKPVPASAFEDGYQYTGNASARDAALNDEVAYTTNTFIVDMTSPTSKVSNPAHQGFLGSLTLISGTADDRYCTLRAPFTCPGANGRDFESGIAVTSVAVALGRYSDAKYWDGAGFNSDAPVWSTASFTGASSGTWGYAIPGGALVDGSSYTVSSWVLSDRAGNVQLAITTNTFSVDALDPVAVATGPSGALSQMEDIAGTARDPPIGVLDMVLLKIVQLSGPSAPAVWNGAGWTGGSPDIWVGTGTIGSLVTGTTYTWRFDLSQVAWDSQASYEIWARARDKGGRLSPTKEDPDLTFNILGPQSGITTPGVGQPHFKSSGLTVIAGTGVNASTAAVRLIQSGPDLVVGSGNDDLVWTGGAWASTSPWPGACAATACFLGVHSYDVGATPDAWGFNFAAANWQTGASGLRYQVESKAASGGSSEVDFTGPETRAFVIDDANPTVAVANPSASAHKPGTLGTLAGTALDGAPGVISNATVKFRIIRVRDDEEFNVGASTFVAPSASNDLLATPGSGGYFTFSDSDLTSDIAFEDGLLYKVRLSASDLAGNAQNVEAQFRYDVSLPTAAITVPRSEVTSNALTTIEGTTVDTDPDTGSADVQGSGATEVEVYLQKQADGKYFNGTGFTATSPFPLAATVVGGGWSYSDGDLEGALGQGGRYTIYARAIDAAGNAQNAYTAAGSSFTFSFDKRAPDIAITAPTEGTSYSTGAIVSAGLTGTASDPLVAGTSSGLVLDGIDVQLWYVVGVSSYYWTGSAWSTTISTLTADGASWSVAGGALPPAVGANSWSRGSGDAVPTDHRFYAQARAHDASRLPNGDVSSSTGNVSGWAGPVAFIVDATPPVSSVTWPVNGLFTNAISSITGTANGALSGIQSVEIRITTNPGTGPDWNGSTMTFAGVPIWRPVTVTGGDWTYPGSTGDTLSNATGEAFVNGRKYFVYSRVRDAANVLEPVPPVFGLTFDTTLPGLTLHFPHASGMNAFYSNNGESSRPLLRSSGSVTDTGTNASGLSEVWVAVSSGAGENVWWHDADQAFTVTQSTIHWSTQVYVSGGDWSFTPAAWSGALLKDGVSYKVFAKARDRAGNWIHDAINPSDGNAKFSSAKYDLTRPTGTVTTPAAGSDVKALSSFQGSAADTGLNVSGVERVYIAVQRTTPGQEAYWEWGASWNSGVATPPPGPPGGIAWTRVASTTLTGEPSVVWSTPVPAGMLASSNTYRVLVTALDWAGNRPSDAEAGDAGAGVSFRYDNELPVVAVNAPAAAGYLNAATLTDMAGSGSDAVTGNSGLQFVEILLKAESPLDAYWKGSNDNQGAIGDNWDQTASKYNRWVPVTGPLTSWTKSFPTMAPVDSLRFRLWVRAADMAGNNLAMPTTAQLDADQNADGGAARVFSYDNTPPVSRATGPAVYVNALPTGVAGTAEDAYASLVPSGVNEVRVKLRRSNGGGGEFWNFVNAWGADPGWINVSGNLSAWSKSVPPDQFADGYQYAVNSSAKDSAVNTENAFSTRTFTVDRTTPTAAVLYPGPDTWLGAVTTLSGTAEDRYCKLNAPGACPGAGGRDYESGIAGSSVAVAIQRVSDGLFWDGGAFGPASAVWSTAAFVGDSSGTWTYGVPAGGLVDGIQYRVSVRVLNDRAGNSQFAPASTNTFIVDAQDPVSVATAPAGSLNQVFALYGTASDAALGELDVVLLRIKQTGGNGAPAVWDGGGWVGGNPEIWIGTATIGSLVTQTTYTWSFNASTIPWRTPGTYELIARARDKSGRMRPAPGGLAADATFSINGPQSGLTAPANQGHYKSASLASIQGTAINASSAQVRLLQSGVDLQFDAGGDDLVWNGEAFVSTNAFAGYVGASSYDGSGDPDTWALAFNTAEWAPARKYRAISRATQTLNVETDYTGPETRDFVIDDQAPTASISLPTLGAYHAGQIGTLTGDAADVAPGELPTNTIKYRIIRLKDDYEWNVGASTFQASGSDLTATPQLGGVFTYTDSNLASDAVWQDGHLYKVRLTVLDKAGNQTMVEQPSAGFRYDVSYPTATVTLPAQGLKGINSLPSLAGNKADQDPDGTPSSDSEGSGVAAVNVFVQKLSNGLYFNGVNFLESDPTGMPATLHVSSWTYFDADLEGALTDGDYSIYAKATDAAGNTQYSFEAAGSSFTFRVDKTAPTVS
ncbi:MAG: hypothetical protein HY554_15540, partial [Elusimicrobia bacterium]|nr:hypothetical protein [Elusimicrobiota bacterium]